MAENVEVRFVKEATTTPLVIGHKIFAPFGDYTLTEYDLEKAKKDLGETDEKIQSCLYELKQKLRDDNVMCRMDDDYLLRYLRTKKYNYKNAYTYIHNLYSSRRKYPELFYFDPKLEKFLPIMNSILAYKDADNCPVYVFQFDKWNPDVLPVSDLLRIIFVTWDLVTMNPHNQVNGGKLIFDTKGLTMSHGNQIIRNVRMMSFLLQNLYPLRIANLILLNVHPIVSVILKIISPLIKQKMIDKITIIGSDYKELHKYVSPEILITEYGGMLEIKDFDLTKYINDNKDYLKYERSFGYLLNEKC